jgi:hypothetical protein
MPFDVGLVPDHSPGLALVTQVVLSVATFELALVTQNWSRHRGGDSFNGRWFT